MWTEDGVGEKQNRRSIDIIEAYAQTSDPTLYLLVKCHDGFTRKMLNKAAREESGVFSALAYAEGPYGEWAIHQFYQ